MSEHAREAAAKAVGSSLKKARSVGGGSINDAWLCELADGRRVFVKTNRSADPTMFSAEARGLRWLSEAEAIRIPEVLAVSRESDSGPHFIVLEYLEPGAKKGDFEQLLGQQLAALHRSCDREDFGLDHDNFIGSLPQYNEKRDGWADFYRDMRLKPQLEMAVERGLATVEMRRGFERLFDRLDELVGSPEPPARLHGDLWGGNLHCGPDGEPCLIDPAVFAGHREIDLAMMQLFGGFGSRVFDAYHEAHPLDPEWRERTDLYQLYFLMVHVNLFGGGYVGQALRALGRYV